MSYDSGQQASPLTRTIVAPLIKLFGIAKEVVGEGWGVVELRGPGINVSGRKIESLSQVSSQFAAKWICSPPRISGATLGRTIESHGGWLVFYRARRSNRANSNTRRGSGRVSESLRNT